MLTTAIPENGL